MGENNPNKVFTIGVYGFSENKFFDALINANIELFCDIRQRRGVRGSKYSFVNSKRLQEKLEQLNIQYIHIKELAPTKEIRQKQHEADVSNGTSKRKRKYLGEVFRIEYRNKILNNFDFESSLIQTIIKNKNILLFCVEQNPEACHRSLVSRRMQFQWGIQVEDLIP